MNTTLRAFLREMLYAGKQRTLQTATQDVQQLRIAKGFDPNSANTGTYGAVRPKIDVKVPLSLLHTVARNAENAVPNEMKLCGHSVTDNDDSSNSIQNTENNQEEYTQPKLQKDGLGFPMWWVVVLISAATVMVQTVAWGPRRGKCTVVVGKSKWICGRSSRSWSWPQS